MISKSTPTANIARRAGPPSWTLCVISSLMPLAFIAEAQDLSRVLPEPVPALVEPIAKPAPDTQAQLSLSESELAQLPARPGEAVILPELKGVRIVGDDSRLLPGIATLPEPVVVEEVLTLDNEIGKTIPLPFIGKPASQESIERLRVALKIALSMGGRSFSVVYIPPQDVTSGYLQIVVVESTIGQIRVEGNEHFSDTSYLSRLTQKEGEPVDPEALKVAVDRINQNSFRNAATRVEKGSEPGTTDIVIQARDRYPLRFFAGYNNTGTQTTKEDRLTAGVNWGNAFGLGHLWTLQVTSDVRAKHSKSISTNYTADLPHNHSVTVFGAYSETLGDVGPTLNQEGSSYQIGINYDIPFRKIGPNYSHRLQLGLDFKSSDNNLDFILPPFVLPISNNLTHIVQGRVEYRGTLPDELGTTAFGAKLTVAPGELSSRNDDAAFALSRSGATADYAYVQFDVSRNTKLPNLLPGWNWLVRGEAQFASQNLLGSEQFSAGGMGTVRGYEESEVVGDNALFFSQELSLPEMRPSRKIFKSDHPESLRPYLFHDYARTWNTDKLPGEQAFNLHSVGLGLRYQYAQYANLQFAYGWQLKDSGSSDTGDNRRAHISFQISY